MEYKKLLSEFTKVLLIEDLSNLSKGETDAIKRVLREVKSIYTAIKKTPSIRMNSFSSGVITFSEDYELNYKEITSKFNKDFSLANNRSTSDFCKALIKFLVVNTSTIKIKDAIRVIKKNNIVRYKYYLNNVKAKRLLLKSYYNKFNVDYRIIKTYLQRECGLSSKEKMFYQKLQRVASTKSIEWELYDLYAKYVKLFMVSLYFIREVNSDNNVESMMSYEELHDKLERVSVTANPNIISSALYIRGYLKDLEVSVPLPNVHNELGLLEFLNENNELMREVINFALSRYRYFASTQV